MLSMLQFHTVGQHSKLSSTLQIVSYQTVLCAGLSDIRRLTAVQQPHPPRQVLQSDVCYEVSLCENCQQQSCKAFIGLTICAKNDFPYQSFFAQIVRPMNALQLCC